MTLNVSVMQKFVALAFCRADLLFEVSQDARIVFCAGATEQVLGLENHQLIGQPLDDIFIESERSMVADIVKSPVPEMRLDEIETYIERANGAPCFAVFSGYRTKEFGDNLFVAIKTLPKRRSVAAARRVNRDDRSGLLHKDSFTDAAAESIRAASDSGSDAKLTLLSLTGLDAGRASVPPETYQNLLDSIGEILKDRAVDGQVAGRIADENFGLVHADDIDETSLRTEIDNAASECGITVETEVQSAAVNDLSLDEDQIGKAIEYTIRGFNKDHSLPGGQNLQDVFAKLMAETVEQVDRFTQICRTRDFDLHFMPICSLTTGEVHHLETLTRFRNPEDDTSSPYKLITLAEEVGVIAEFDLAVARKTINLVEAHAVKREIPALAFNISGLSIQKADFVSELIDMLRHVTNLSGALSLEITESAEIVDFDSVNAAIQEIRARGFKVALDDFGAGAASFDYMNNLDVDFIKFDGPVVKRALRTVKGKAFITSMAALCKTTGVETIAEMVEDKATAEFVASCGVTLGQGYHFGRPHPDPMKFSHNL